MKIDIKTFLLEDVKENDKVLYNVNNIYDKQPSDYWTRRRYTADWIDKFHENKYHTIVIEEHELEWMKKAKNVSQIRHKFPRNFDDELEESCKRHQKEFDKIMEHGDRWFIRTENYSFKYAVHGAGPYNDLKKVIQSLTTFHIGHENIFDSDTKKTIYFIPWIDIDYDKEFRIFVYKNKITAISAQHIYVVNSWLKNKSSGEIEKIVEKIVGYFNENIKDKMSFMESYVMDLALIGESEEPYFIEPNEFGAEYGSGSALFHWITDHDDLHNSDTIQVRFTV